MPTPAELAAAGSIAQGLGAIGSAFGGGSDQKIDYRGAKKGIRWRVRDAKAAGIHPLYALGAPGVGAGILKGQGPSGAQKAGDALQGLGRTATNYSQAAQAKAFNEANIQKVKAETDFINEQMEASRQHREAQNAHQGPAETSPALYGPYNKMPSKKWVVNPDGTGYWINNPDTAMDISELAGGYLNQLLNWTPNMGDFNEAVFGAWKRLGARTFRKLQRAYKRQTGKQLKRPNRYGAM